MSTGYRLQADVAVVTLNRPDRFNAISVEMSGSLVAALDRAGAEARAAVVTGEGKAFSSGADLAELLDDYEAKGPDLARVLDTVFHPVVEALTNCEVPTVAAINGVAAGAGLGLALGCDLRIMARSASMTSAFTAIGLVPDSGTTWLLPAHVGVSKALELTFTNRRVPAEEARELGLCLEVVDDDRLVHRAVEIAASLADLVPDSLVATRRLIRGSAEAGFEGALASERAEQARLGAAPAHMEGVRAFMEKRPPDYRNAGT